MALVISYYRHLMTAAYCSLEMKGNIVGIS